MKLEYSNTFDLGSYTNFNDILLYCDYLSDNYTYTEKTVPPQVAYKFQGNLYGLFSFINIEPEYHFFTMYVNGYKHPTEYDGKKLVIKLPNLQIIEFLKRLQLS